MDDKNVPKCPEGSDATSLIRTYIQAKDENRPHLMARAFAPDATLRMAVKSDAISFPARTEGLQAISDVLVRRFGQAYDNVYTFCVAGTGPEDAAESYRCDWLVGMTTKADGSVRVGCGSYVWQFGRHAAGRLVRELEITIEAMEVLPPELAETVVDGWLSRLPYPWCKASEVHAHAPTLPQLTPVLQYLQP